MSQEYIISIALFVGFILKMFKIEIPNDTIESFIAATATLYVAFRRYQKGDITPFGARK